jgi:hypothetical protein
LSSVAARAVPIDSNGANTGSRASERLVKDVITSSLD